MSIYRRTDRVPLNDVTVAGPTHAADVQSQNDEYWQTRRASQPANGLLRPTMHWATALPTDIRPNALLAKYPRIANLLAVLWQDPFRCAATWTISSSTSAAIGKASHSTFCANFSRFVPISTS